MLPTVHFQHSIASSRCFVFSFIIQIAKLKYHVITLSSFKFLFIHTVYDFNEASK